MHLLDDRREPRRSSPNEPTAPPPGSAVRGRPVGTRWPCLLILLLSASIRLYRLDQPLADHLAAKQVYVANKARAIARPPFNPLRNTLDFLDSEGRRLALTEEIPLYASALGLAFRLFGEREWLGRALSLLGTLTAIAALHDLARREHGSRTAGVAALLFASCPLLIFYGQAVLPDPWMLACMLLAAASYRRHLDGGAPNAFIAAAAFGLAAAVFKCYGLMILVPLAEMTHRQGGWRRVASARFLVLAAAMILPIALWIIVVFARTPNPLRTSWTGTGHAPAYFVVQEPAVLVRPDLYTLFGSRFLARDCGPVAAAFIVSGTFAVALHRVRGGPLAGWTAMGIAFYFLLGPKLPAHDYYELMMLPAAALWGARGWEALVQAASRAAQPIWGQSLGAAALVAAVVVQSPWVDGRFFQVDRGKLIVARRLARLCPPPARVVVAGPGIELPIVVHYSGREGWPLNQDLLADWRLRLARYREKGARYLAVYFESNARDSQRAAFAALDHALPRVDHNAGSWSRSGERCEYSIYSLNEAAPSQTPVDERVASDRAESSARK
jgi:hypothetical protein